LVNLGCSWGYGSWQLEQAGFSVKAYEISKPRCEYAKRHMGVDATWDLHELQGSFDVFFSAHVLEHVPSVGEVISLVEKLLRPGGYFVAFTPNGSDLYRKADPWRWQRSWGMVHPNLLDNEFYSNAFSNTSHLIVSSPYDYGAIEEWARHAGRGIKQKTLSINGNELLCIAMASSF
jgi:2-polyprenyl-3-methyl-5-hydroxy-6-metoxy-1,4-benzoquinol methylase